MRPEYEAILARKLGSDLYASFENSHEMMALFSLAFNNPALVGRGLVAAVKAGRRFDAWYEIRFRSNAKRHPGLQKRRTRESDEFGLYNDPTTAEEAQAVVVFLEDKRGSILAYLDQVSEKETTGRAELDQLMFIAQETVNKASGGTALA